MKVEAAHVYAVIPVLEPIALADVAYRYVERFAGTGGSEELEHDLSARLAAHLRKLRRAGRVEGPPWRRRPVQ